MIRGFFYSLILHIFTFLFIFYGYLADKIKIENAVKYIEIGVNSDFFKENKIKTTERSLYEHLDLRSKINLYNLAKKFINNNDSTISNIPIESINEIVGFNANKTISKDGSYISSKVINAFDKDAFKDPTITNGDVIYLGPTDYKRLIVSKLDDININNMDVEIIKNNEYVLDTDIKKPQNRNETFDVKIDEIFTEEDIKLLKESLNNGYDNSILSKRDKISIQNQFTICYKNAILKTKKQSKFDIAVAIDIKRDGFIDINNIKIEPIDTGISFSKDEYNDTINNVKLALDYCNPVRNLPLGKYKAWKTIKLVFNGF